MGEVRKTSGFVADPEKFGACGLAEMPAMRDKLLTFRSLANGLRNELAAMESEGDWARFYNHALFAIQITKAACDVFMAVATELAPSPVGKAIGKGYGYAADSAGAVTKSMIGQSAGADYLKIGIKGAVEAATKVGKAGQAMQFGSQMLAGNSVLIVDAVNSDADAVIGDLIAKKGEIATFVGEAMEASAKQKTWLAGGVALANAAWAAATAFRDYKKAKQDTTDQFAGMQKTLRNQLAIIEGKIAELEKALADCNAERARMSKQYTPFKPLVAPPPLAMRSPMTPRR